MKTIDGWTRIPMTYKGWPMYINQQSGCLAYEVSGDRLIELPEEHADQVYNELMEVGCDEETIECLF